VNGLNRLEGIFSRIGTGGKPSCKPFRFQQKARPKRKVIIRQGVSSVNLGSGNPFLTSKRQVVCTGFTVRAASTTDINRLIEMVPMVRLEPPRVSPPAAEVSFGENGQTHRLNIIESLPAPRSLFHLGLFLARTFCTQ